MSICDFLLCLFCLNYYRPQRSWGKEIFSEACVKNSVHGGGGGVHGCWQGGGHVWLLVGGGMYGCWRGACMVAGGGMRGCWWGVTCMFAGRGMHSCWWGHAWLLVGGHAWLLVGGMRGCSGMGVHALVAGGVHGCWQGGAWLLAGGHAWRLGGSDIGYDEIRSMSGRYASYWNAFLLLKENLHIRKVSSQILRSNKTITLFVLVSALNIRIVLYFSTGIVYSDSYLMAGARKRRRTSSTDETLPNSQPAKWPGTILTSSV